KLTLMTDDAASPSVEVQLRGAGVAATVSVTPTSLAFGPQLVAHPSSPRSVDLANSGAAPLAVSSIAITGAQSGSFSLMNPPATPLVIAAGAKQTITVVHTPLAAGDEHARIEVATGEPTA